MKIDDNILIDTNILVYQLNADSEFYLFSKTIIEDNLGHIFVCQKSIAEWAAVLSKEGRYDIIEQEFNKIIQKFKIIYTDDFSLGILYELLKKYKPSGNRVYDFEIVSVMIANKIKKIVTINVDDFKKIEEIEVISNKIEK